MLDIGSDSVGMTLRAALDGLALRQRVVANNVANLDTPGFRAEVVDFETSLRSALADGSLTDGTAPAATTSLANTPVGPNGNNVDLQSETMTAMQASLRYQLMTRAVSDRFALVRTAIGSM